SGKGTTVKIWDLADTSREPAVMLHEAPFELVSLNFSPDGSRLAGVFYMGSYTGFNNLHYKGFDIGAAVDFNSSIYLWDATTGRARAQATSKHFRCHVQSRWCKTCRRWNDERSLRSVGRAGERSGWLAHLPLGRRRWRRAEARTRYTAARTAA